MPPLPPGDPTPPAGPKGVFGPVSLGALAGPAAGAGGHDAGGPPPDPGAARRVADDARQAAALECPGGRSHARRVAGPLRPGGPRTAIARPGAGPAVNGARSRPSGERPTACSPTKTWSGGVVPSCTSGAVGPRCSMLG